MGVLASFSFDQASEWRQTAFPWQIASLQEFSRRGRHYKGETKQQGGRSKGGAISSDS
jgi:hypothetical protein